MLDNKKQPSIRGTTTLSPREGRRDKKAVRLSHISLKNHSQVLKQVDIATVLADNDAYHALACCDGLIVTGATGTNVNDLTVLLIKR